MSIKGTAVHGRQEKEEGRQKEKGNLTEGKDAVTCTLDRQQIV